MSRVGTTKVQLHGFWLGVMEVTEQMSIQLAFEIEPDSAGNYIGENGCH